MCQHQRLNYRIAALRVRLALLDVRRVGLKAGFREDQSRGPDGRWDGGSGSHASVRIDKTGNPRIDAKTEMLVDVVKQVAERVGYDGGALKGVSIHTLSAAAIRERDIPGIGRHGVEQSFGRGDVVRYGLSGSIRIDIIARDGRTDAVPILAVWDIKTGNVRLEASRVAEIRSALGIGSDVPVIEIHVRLGINVKSWFYQRY